MSVEFLRRLPLFSAMSEADLNWLIEQARPVDLKAGDVLIREGDPGDAMYVVLDGEFEISKKSDVQDIVIAVREPGEVIGEMSLLDHAPRSASVRAKRDSHLLEIGHNAFTQLLESSPSAAMAILHTVSTRLRQNEALLRQNEKMAALGTLSAGLAHELNNPAGAVQRGASQLRQQITTWERLAAEINWFQLEAHQKVKLDALRARIPKHAISPVQLDLLTRGDRESEMQEWLEDHGVEEAWELAPNLVSFGWGIEDVEQLNQTFSEHQLPLVLAWISAGCSAHALLHELHMGAERISEIVKAVKSYSYLDQAPVQNIDVHEGLENTLVILRHKLKQGVNVTREYAPDLPHIEAYGSQLNQVWTNIIDNAIDAMNGQGEITLRTFMKEGRVVVELADNGPGIPPEIQARIFEPFFTTKPPGVGTGMGLHIAYNIVYNHYGQLRVNSRPGATCFQVTLPVQLKRG